MSEAEVEALALYVELVHTWNARTNLTGAREPRALADVLLADAFVLADRAFIPDGARVADIGAGAGAPSIPIALLRPDTTFTLVEPRAKRVAFLRTAIASSGLSERVSVVERRLETATLGPLDVALSRATFEPAAWLTKGMAIAPRVIVLTGADALPCGAVHAREYALPFAGTSRHVGLYTR